MSKVVIRCLTYREIVEIFKKLFNSISKRNPAAVNASFKELTAQEQVKLIDLFKKPDGE